VSTFADYSAAVYDVRMGDSKVCRVCGEDKPLEAFSPRRANSDGFETRCRLCYAAYRKEYLKKNPDVAAKRRADSRERGRAKRSTPEGRKSVAEATKRWREKNRDRARALGRAQYGKREALKKGASSHSVSTHEAKRIIESPCANCGATENIQIDHIIPLSRGGSHSIGNLQPLCAYCNITKHNSLQIEWRFRSGNYGRSYVESGLA